MKKIYELPLCQLVHLTAVDILTTSTTVTQEDDELPILKMK